MPEPIQAPAAPAVTPPAPPGGQMPVGQPQPGGAATETFTIDGQQLTADQVREALKAKTDYEQLQPEFTRKSQLLTDPEKLWDFASKQFPDRFKAPPTTPPVPPTPQEAQLDAFITAARQRGQLMTREEAQQMWAEQRELDELTNTFRTEIGSLSKEWDGADGKPKFDLNAVQEFMLKNGYPNLTSAFEQMNKDALREWYAAQKPKPKAPVVAGPGGGSVPVAKDKPLRLDSPEFDQRADEILDGG